MFAAVCHISVTTTVFAVHSNWVAGAVSRIWVNNFTGSLPGNAFSYLQVGHLLLSRH